MSMIDCSITVDKKRAEKGDRVVLTFECVVLIFKLLSTRCLMSCSSNSGKFLSYSKW